MSKLTREDLIDGIFTSYRKKSDVRDESRRIIQDAIITTAEKIDDYFELECDPIEPGCFLWDVVENAINTTENAMLSIGKILEQFGIKAGDLGIDLSGTSTNTRSMDDNIVTLTRSGGRTIVTENGVSTPMSLYDDMIPSDMTEKLISMSMADRIYPLADMKIPEIKVTGGGNVYTTNNAPLFSVEVKGDMTKDTLPDLNTILKKASKFTQNEMRKNIKRFG